MPEVSVEINGRKYRMACEEGQEEHLTNLAERFNGLVENFKGSVGEIGDNRLTVMAGIAVLDELNEAERRIEALRQEVDDMREARDAGAAEVQELERQFARRLSETARKIEAVATVIDETAQGQAGEVAPSE